MSAARSIARFVFGRILPRRPYTVLRGPLRGARFILGSMAGRGGGASVYFGLVEPEQTRAIVAAVKPGDVFFDVGANVGYYSLLASRLVGPSGKVIAFEPLPRNVELLRRHVELNGADNITAEAAAVSNSIGRTRFELGADTSLGRIGEGEIEVGTTTIDAAIEKHGVTPDVMKIDVEGGERDVLLGAAGMFVHRRPAIFLSTHSDELRAWCIEHLRGLGYEVETLGDDPHELMAAMKS